VRTGNTGWSGCVIRAGYDGRIILATLQPAPIDAYLSLAS